MQKDKRTRKKRVADANRVWKNYIKAKARDKTKKQRLADKRRKRKAEEKAFVQHMARLQGELGENQ